MPAMRIGEQRKVWVGPTEELAANTPRLRPPGYELLTCTTRGIVTLWVRRER